MSKDPQTYEITGAAIEVHRHLGHGFREAVYQEAPAMERAKRNIPFKREMAIPVEYKGQRVQCSSRADFIGFEEVVLELKALNQLTGVDESQLVSDLKATGMHRGLLLNFGASSLEYKRLVLNLRQSADEIENINLIGA